MPEYPRDFNADTMITSQKFAEISSSILQNLSRPSLALQTLIQTAKSHAAYNAQRDTYGLGPISQGGSDALNSAQELSSVALARQLLALCRSEGLPAEGAPLGAFNAYYDTLSSDSKLLILSDLPDMKINPSWYNLLLAKNQQLIVNDLKGQPLDLSPIDGPIMVPKQNPSAFELATSHSLSELVQKHVPQTIRNELTLQGPREGPSDENLNEFFTKTSFVPLINDIAKLRMSIAEHTTDTGLSWREQNFTQLFTKNVDVQLHTLSMTLFSVAKQCNIPPSDPQFKSAIRSVCQVMSAYESTKTLSHLKEKILKTQTPETQESWKTFFNDLQKNLQWSVGQPTPSDQMSSVSRDEVLVDAETKKNIDAELQQDSSLTQKTITPTPSLPSSPSLSNPDPSEPSSRIEPGFDQPSVSSDFSQSETSVLMNQDPVYAKAVAFGRICKGFVDSFSPAHLKTKAQQLSQTVQRASTEAHAKIKSILETSASSLDKFVDYSNHLTDKVEHTVADKVRDVKNVLNAAAENAALAAGSTVAHTREAFVGKVGELTSAAKESVGLVALKTADALPDSFKAPAPEQMNPKKVALIQVSAIAGALFVGAAMAPVAGVAAATVGALAAGMGLARALKQAGEKFGNATRALPFALEDIGAKLGAKRSQTSISIDRVEPSAGFAAPGL